MPKTYGFHKINSWFLIVQWETIGEFIVVELGKKPRSYDDIEAQYIGLIKISGRVIGQVCDFYNSLDQNAIYDGKDYNNMYMTSFLQMIIDQLMPIKAVRIDGGWLEIDCVDDMKSVMC